MKSLPSSIGSSSNHTTSNSRVCVLLPCHNDAITLNDALVSIRAQEFEAMEVVLVDDGSTDNSLSIMRKHASEDQRVRILNQGKMGIVPALNRGLSECRAPFVARMDADDISHPSRLKKQLRYLDQHPDVAVVGSLVDGLPSQKMGEGFKRYIEWINTLRSHEHIIREIFIESPFVHPSVMMRTEWLNLVGGYQDRDWAEDYDLWLRLHLAGARFGKVPEVLLSWRDRIDRLTRRDERYSKRNFIRAKSHYLMKGPLHHRDAVFIWGAGKTGKLFLRYLLEEQAPLVALIDVDPGKIGRTRRGLPVYAPDDLPQLWRRYQNPALLAAVAVRGARQLIREHLTSLCFEEGADWWAVA